MHFKNQFLIICILSKVLPIILASPILRHTLEVLYAFHFTALIFGSSVLNVKYKQDTNQLLLQIRTY